MNPPDPKFKRYSSKKFPPYSYIPGLNPHPTESPQGHSFGQKDPDGSILTPQTWAKNEVYLYGIDLYNYAHWWESHEAFEILWRKSTDQPTSDFLQGLIKISAAFIKWYVKSQRGVVTLYEGALGHLERAAAQSEVYLGIDLNEHLKKLKSHFGPVIEGQWTDPFKNYPFIKLKGGTWDA